MNDISGEFDAGKGGFEKLNQCLAEYSRLSAYFAAAPRQSLEHPPAYGVRIGDLKPVSEAISDDLFLISQDSWKYSNKVSYLDFVSNIDVDAMSALNVKDMAFESKYKYSKAVHDHERQYRRTKIQGVPFEDPALICRFKIGQPGVQGLGSNYQTVDICTSALVSYSLPEQEVGSTKLVFLKAGAVREANSQLVQKADFDGWVYADGTTFDNVDPQRFKTAIAKFGSGTSFTVPKLSGFYKIVKQATSDLSTLHEGHLSQVPEHTHIIDPIPVTGTITSKATISTWQDPRNSKVENKMKIHTGIPKKDTSYSFNINLSSLNIPVLTMNKYVPEKTGDGNFVPRHQKLYPMVYIGGQAEVMI